MEKLLTTSSNKKVVEGGAYVLSYCRTTSASCSRSSIAVSRSENKNKEITLIREYPKQIKPDQQTNKQTKERARKLDEKQHIQSGPQVATGLFHRTQTRGVKHS